MTPLIRMTNVALGYGPHTVLRIDNLTIEQGDAWFLLGPNGAGKTTLLRAALGLIDTQAGALTRHDDCKGHDRIGFVPQACEMTPSLPTTVREFVSLGLVGLSLPHTERDVRLQRALDRVHLLQVARRDFWTLSGGQRQRAMLARAIIREPLFLVLDEPTNGLDPTAEESLLNVLDTLRREERLTTLFVTHDVFLAGRHATHIALAHNGKLLAGPRDKILTAENLRAVFGTNPMQAMP